jgi:uncharacterized membrane protein YozB (DUF420 family)
MVASFLGTKAGFSADASLVIAVAAAVMLTIGWRLAVAKRYEAHRWVQTVAVCLNALPIVAWMIRAFAKYVAPDLPGNLSQGSYLLTTIHAVAGAAGVALGMYVMIRANRLEDQGRNPGTLKNTMRVAYALYMLVTLAGVAVYIVLYR